MKTTENLLKAFAGESQANRKYLAFAKKADEEGFAAVAKLFRAAAEAETVHAHTHLRNLNGVGTTAENLKVAIEGETAEFESMYPGMIADAEEENQTAARMGFSHANTVEMEHADLYKKAAQDPANFEIQEVWVCGVCGHTHVGPAPDNCPVCGAPKERFTEIK
jgi:rubrerythrin